MKINNKILSLPPYISTSWKMISSIQLIEENDTSILAIILKDGPLVKIPHLPREIVDKIFAYHASFLEEGDEKQALSFNREGSFLDIPLQFGSNGFQGFGPLQHNPEQANSPDMPIELLNKITQVTTAFSSALGTEESSSIELPEPQPNCNCMHCQIVRAMKGQSKEVVEIEESVDEVDLKFKEFDIHKKGDKLYEVVNPLDQTEHFQVFLGTPLGCTCGKKNCEHIKAVLNS
jgi:hypothetical protein